MMSFVETCLNLSATKWRVFISSSENKALLNGLPFRDLNCSQIFLLFKPAAKILFMGNTPSRTRLYRGIINKYLAQMEQIYEIHGIINRMNEPFQGHKTYDAFLIFLKDK